MIISRVLRHISKTWFNVRKKTKQSVQSAKDTALRTGTIVVSIIFVIWLSIFLYTAFYYAYMPSMSYVRPVHLQFK